MSGRICPKCKEGMGDVLIDGYNPGKHNVVWFVPKCVEKHIKKCFKLKTFKQVEIKIKELIGK